MQKFTLCFFLLFYSLTSNAQGDYIVIANWDTLQFEQPYDYLSIDSSEQNIWQIGDPQKTFFNTPFSSNNAIVTDLVNTYPPNTYSYFDLYVGKFNYPEDEMGGFGESYPYNIFMEIKHKYDTDPSKDGGYITVSYDNGATWMNIIKDTVYGHGLTPGDGVSGNLYYESDKLSNGESGFSGTSDGWVSTWFGWHLLPVKNGATDVDTMILRFNFVSDEIDNPKEGWMIDDIRLYSIDIGANITSFTAENALLIYPNPINQQTITDWKTRAKQVTIEVANIAGIQVFRAQYFNQEKTQLDITHLPNGVYFVKALLEGSEPLIQKIIIE